MNMSKIKSIQNGSHSRLDNEEGKISELEDRAIDTIKNETEQNWLKKMNRESMRCRENSNSLNCGFGGRRREEK